MPKKRTYNFKTFRGSTSSNNKHSATNSTNDAAPSVNERLSELRKLETKDAAARKRQLAESVNQRSVPPDVRSLLGVPESAPPNPKANVRTRERMRTPGPAPPRSWLARSSTTWKLRKNADKNGRSQPKHLLRFTRLTGFEDDSVDEQPSSLTHLALKTIAASWDFLDEEDYPALTDIPLRLRLRLLSYIGFYGSTLGITALRALIQGNESIQCLDLAGLIGYGNLSLRRLGRLIEQGQEREFKEKESKVAESWDVEDTVEAALQPSLSRNRFSNLTHLCLSHPVATISWRDLIAFSRHIPQVTHLSLAYWPRPTLTPNLSTTTVSSQHSPDVTAGGSHFYSDLDQDLDEPASLLRQLSSNLLCLQWMDLEGCEEWIPAMGKLATYSADRHTDDEWVGSLQNTPSIFTSNWKNLNHIRCAQGWLPSLNGIHGLAERREGTVIDAVLIDGITKHLKQSDGALDLENHHSQDLIDVEKKKARIWLDREHGVTYACMRINSSRRAQGLKSIVADFGWIQRHVGST